MGASPRAPSQFVGSKSNDAAGRQWMRRGDIRREARREDDRPWAGRRWRDAQPTRTNLAAAPSDAEQRELLSRLTKKIFSVELALLAQDIPPARQAGRTIEKLRRCDFARERQVMGRRKRFAALRCSWW